MYFYQRNIIIGKINYGISNGLIFVIKNKIYVNVIIF